MYEIDLGQKFTSRNLESVINQSWEQSFKSAVVYFNFKKLEWIAIEEMTFLLSWINKLFLTGVKINIYLQDAGDIMSTDERFKKRQLCLDYLILHWNIEVLLKKIAQLLPGSIRSNQKFINVRSIPYVVIPSIDYEIDSFDTEFDEIHNTFLNNFQRYIKGVLQENTFLSYFDNHFLHYSIIKELYSNTCQHAFGKHDEIQNNCNVSLKYDSKIKITDYNILEDRLIKRYHERPYEEQEYFKSYSGKFGNLSHVEFTFMDFGVGISKTLKDNYNSESWNDIKDKFGKDHSKKNIDTRVLEYAFLLFTSKYEFQEDLIMHDFVPRGLYIVKDIVRKYGGMIIARSNKGKVVYDFKDYGNSGLSNCVYYRPDDSEDKVGIGFPGTSITIILPAKEPEQIIRRILSHKSKRISSKLIRKEIQLLKLNADAINYLESEKFESESKKKQKYFEYFFEKLSNEIYNFSTANQHNLIMLDFAGMERSHGDVYSKLLFFLAYCSLINENTNALLFNVIEKDIKYSLQNTENYDIKSKGFHAKPIPCIHPDMSITWIGIDDEEIENILSNIWKGDDRDGLTDLQLEYLEGNVLEIEWKSEGRNNIRFRVPSYSEILNYIIEYHTISIENEINNRGIHFNQLYSVDENGIEHDYNQIIKITKGRAYLTASGIFQNEFLTFIEKLYLREYRRLIATYFIFNFYYNDKLTKQNEITKILTVTLSSQLLGKEVKYVYEKLKKNETEVDLIPLSNYYDFASEESFHEISKADNVLVVNDVISTGNLSGRIYQSLKEKGADLIALIAIVDSRDVTQKLPEFENLIISLTKKYIEKFCYNPHPDEDPIWINPILNAPTTMKREKSNYENILLTASEFVDYFKDDKLFKIGHLKQNTIYHTYYLQTDLLFDNEIQNDYPILKKLLELLDLRIVGNKLSRLEKYKENLLDLSRSENELFTGKDIFKTHKSIEYLIKKLTTVINSKKQLELIKSHYELKIDYVFYPFMSNASVLENDLNSLLLNYRKTHKIEVYPIPRIMTPKGWRFTFPPKFLNSQSKDKSVLIIDDGSCTGETIIQMIDTISFLAVSEITVLSIFARLEDFQREYLTRIKEIKVKNTIIPINIYFGTHFHIPVYSRNNNPFLIEARELDGLKEYYIRKGEDLPQHLRIYIENRLNQIQFTSYLTSEFADIPLDINKRKMFLIRNIIGTYDSYRLYKEDEPVPSETGKLTTKENFEKLVQDNEGKLALIAVLIHEPKMIDTVNRIYSTINNDILKFIIELPDKEPVLFEKLNKTFLIRAVSLLDLNTFLNKDFLILWMEIIDKQLTIKAKEKTLIENDFFTYYFIAYKLSAIQLNTNPTSSEYNYKFKIPLLIQTIWLYLWENNFSQKQYYNLFKSLYNDFLPSTIISTESKEIKALHELRNYYTTSTIDQPGHTPQYIRLSKLITILQGNFKGEQNIDKRANFLSLFNELYAKLESDILFSIDILFNRLLEFDKKADLSINVQEYKNAIDKYININVLINKKEFIENGFSKEDYTRIANELLEFQNKIVNAKSNLSLFIIHSQSDIEKKWSECLIEFNEVNNLNWVIDINNKIGIDVILNIHPFFIKTIFLEILRNKKRHAETSICHIIMFENSEDIIFRYTQNSPFKKQTGENGLILIRKALNIYDSTYIQGIENNYSFDLVFPKQLNFNHDANR